MFLQNVIPGSLELIVVMDKVLSTAFGADRDGALEPEYAPFSGTDLYVQRSVWSPLRQQDGRLMARTHPSLFHFPGLA